MWFLTPTTFGVRHSGPDEDFAVRCLQFHQIVVDLVVQFHLDFPRACAPRGSQEGGICSASDGGDVCKHLWVCRTRKTNICVRDASPLPSKIRIRSPQVDSSTQSVPSGAPAEKGASYVVHCGVIGFSNWWVCFFRKKLRIPVGCVRHVGAHAENFESPFCGAPGILNAAF